MLINDTQICIYAMIQNGNSEMKTQFEDTYARSEPEITEAGETDSCGWCSCNVE